MTAFESIVQSLISGRPAVDFSTTVAEKEALAGLFELLSEDTE